MNIRIFYSLIFLIIISTGTAFAETTSLISVETDDDNYDEGDTIVISGQVGIIVGDTQITLQLFREGNMIEIAQIQVSKDGNYSHTIIAEGQLWKNQGEYIVKVAYGEGNIAESTFLFTPKSAIIDTTDIFEVDAGNSGTFDIQYTIRGGTIQDISIDPHIFGLIIKIDASDEGKIILDLPRKFIDAEKQNGKDEIFIILIEKENKEVVETTYEEATSYSEIRTITINFEEGDSVVQVIGTYVIPEFGTIVMIILIIGIMISILLTKNKFQIKI
jgi:predicted secreted protein with PEFG-CTERM motif